MITVHVERRAPAPVEVVGAADWRISADPAAGWRLHAHGAPPRQPGPLDDDAVVALMAAADRVIVW